MRGREAIREVMTPLLDDPAHSLAWSPLHGEVSASGDLGYVRGVWELSVNGSTMLRGMYMTAWRRDGAEWKVVADIGNAADE